MVARSLCECSTYFKHKSVHKYTKVVIEQEEVEIESKIDPVLVQGNGKYEEKCTRCQDSAKIETRPHISLCCNL